jgi:AcrR family transcriptional regulator
MVASTATLIRERGARATSLDDVLAHSGAPRGSIYHHFPDGKAQLLEEAVQLADGVTRRIIERAAADGDPRKAIDAFLEIWRRSLAETDARAGCPVVAVAVEGDEERPRAAAGAAFAGWCELLAGLMVKRGIEEERAQGLATLIVSAVEGGVILARAQKDIAPLERVAAELHTLLDSVL